MEEINVQRQFPLQSTLWGLLFAGLSVLAALMEVSLFADWRSAGYTIYWSNPSSTVMSLIFVGLFLAGFLIGVVIYLRPLVAFLVDPRPFIIGTDWVRLGDHSVAYRDIARLYQDARNAVTTVQDRSGRLIRLHWAIWRDPGDWNEELAERSLPAVLLAFRQRIAAGERVAFGKVLALDQNALYVKSKAVPFDRITSLHFQDTQDENVDRRELHIGTLNKTHKIEDRKIENPHIFVALTKALVEAKQSAR